MFIEDDGIRLHAALDIPDDGREKHPLVIVIHGFTGHMEEEHILAASAAARRAGFATLRAEMYGHGASSGEFRNHTLFKWITNALAVIDYAGGLDCVTDLYLMGHSQGGLLVMLAGALRRDVIKGIAPLSPACMIPEGARRGNLLGYGFDPDNIPEEIVFPDGKRLSGNYLRIAQMINVEQTAYRFKGPVLIVHGDADETVPIGFGKQAAEQYGNCTFVTIPGAPHCYDDHMQEMADAVENWFREIANGT